MRRQRFTKIVATLGPASASNERLRALFEAGADVFRLNFSHGVHDDHRQRVEQLRALEKHYKHPVAILMDLQGPKLRLGAFAKGPMELTVGQKLRFDLDPTPGTAKRVPLPHPEIFKAAQPGGLLLVDDGKVRLRIVAHDAKTIDVGVEMPPEAVPPLQKRILAACRVAGRPAIVATQMLDSMVHSPTPTRAEA